MASSCFTAWHAWLTSSFYSVLDFFPLSFPFLLYSICRPHLQLHVSITGSSETTPNYCNYIKCLKKHTQKKTPQSQYSERKTIFTNVEHKFPVQEGELNSVFPCNLSLGDPFIALQINFPPVIFTLNWTQTSKWIHVVFS